jgi:hypothetical protein
MDKKKNKGAKKVKEITKEVKAMAKDLVDQDEFYAFDIKERPRNSGEGIKDWG